MTMVTKIDFDTFRKEIKEDLKDIKTAQTKHSWYIGIGFGILLCGSVLLKLNLKLEIPESREQTHQQIIAIREPQNPFDYIDRKK